ncbi:MAG: ketopantoate reductase family protein [Planctomycetota bacterium]
MIPAGANPRRIVIIGAGAIGGSVGALLHEHTQLEVWLVARGDHGARIASHGLRLKTPGADRTLTLPSRQAIADVDWQAGDLAILATKLNDAREALTELAAAAAAGLPVACLTNGVEAESWARQSFTEVISAVIWMPASHLQPGEVTLHAHECAGVIDLGNVGTIDGPHAQWLKAQLQSARFDSLVRADITRYKHAKLITNLGNAAQALVTDDWRRVAAAARAEGERTLQAAEIDYAPVAELLERTAHVTEAPVDGQLRSGGSTWQSQQRRRELETHWIEGAVARLAAKHGVSAPILHRLAQAAAARKPASAASFLGEA